MTSPFQPTPGTLASQAAQAFGRIGPVAQVIHSNLMVARDLRMKLEEKAFQYHGHRFEWFHVDDSRGTCLESVRSIGRTIFQVDVEVKAASGVLRSLGDAARSVCQAFDEQFALPVPEELKALEIEFGDIEAEAVKNSVRVSWIVSQATQTIAGVIAAELLEVNPSQEQIADFLGD